MLHAAFVALFVTFVTMTWALAAETEARAATVSDFATCNKEATEATAGSALPGRRGPQERTPGIPGPDAAPSARPTPAPPPGTTDPTGKMLIEPADPLLEGMAADRMGDAAYRTAYRACMAQKGIPKRPGS